MKFLLLKKRIIPAMIISVFTLLILNNPAEANMLNRFKKGFYFEKYSSGEEAKEDLLKMHPVGSDVEALVETLRGAGAEVKEENLENYHKFKEYDLWWKEGTVKMYDYKYSNKSFINPVTWGGGIAIDRNNNIIHFGVGKQYMGL